MTGIFIVAFYTLFWGVCWLLSGIFNYKKAKNPLRRRKWVCFWMLMIPMYFHAFEFVFLMNECSNSQVYFPEEKIERPNVLITNGRGSTNTGKTFRGSKKFDYLISPIKSSNPNGYDSVDFSIGRKQFENYGIYRDVLKRSSSYKEMVVGVQRLEILDNANFALYANIHRAWSFVWHENFIYDYKSKKKIAGFTTVSQSISDSSFRNFLTLIRMPKCTYNHGEYKYQDLRINLLLENTFIREIK